MNIHHSRRLKFIHGFVKLRDESIEFIAYAESGILMHMRTTLNIDPELLKKAMEATGLKEKTAVVAAGLQALVAREAARRLALLGGTMPELRPIPRRRIPKAK